MAYLSCEWIEYRVVLDVLELKFCCIPHSAGTKGFVPICKFDGGKLPVEEILRERKKLRELNNQEGVDSPCKGCHWLRKHDWEELDGHSIFNQIDISNFTACNLRCNYCYTFLHQDWNLPKYGYELIPIFEDLIENGYLQSGAQIDWGGGEPTILKEFPGLQGMLLEKGFRQRIFTNAVVFSKEIEAGLARKKVSVVTSIDAGNPETYREIKGRDAFDAVWDHVARYASTGGDVTVKYILRDGNSNRENVKQFIRRCKESGVPAVSITPDIEELAQGTLTEETLYAYALMVHEAEKHGIPVSVRYEYLDHESRELSRKYTPLSRGRWLYFSYRTRSALKEISGNLWRSLRQCLKSGKTRSAIKTAEACLSKGSCDLDTVHDLLDHLSGYPGRDLRSRMIEVLKTLDIPGKQVLDGGVAALGISPDAWTTDCKPCYLVIGGDASGKPGVRDLWITCSADPGEMPITLTINDDVRDIKYTFHQPERVRIVLPEIPAGRSRLCIVNTDKCWIPQEGEDRRRFGVHISTRQ